MLRPRLVSIAGLACAAALALGVPAAGATGLATFSSPSMNIGCELFQVEGHWIARCDIGEREWAPPRAPHRCRLDYGQGVYVSGAGGRGSYVCAGDTALGPKTILGYGDSIRRGALKCLSLTTGMRCNDTSDGHGFLISRERVLRY